MIDNLVLFNGLSTDLVDGLKESNYGKIITLTRIQLKKCKNCRYKYGCPDCRAVECAISGEINGNALCLRNTL